MKSVLHEQRRSSIAAAIVTMGLGAALLCWPVRSAEILCLLLGAAILITGVIYIVGWISRRREGFPLPFLLPTLLQYLSVWKLLHDIARRFPKLLQNRILLLFFSLCFCLIPLLFQLLALLLILLQFCHTLVVDLFCKMTGTLISG